MLDDDDDDDDDDVYDATMMISSMVDHIWSQCLPIWGLGHLSIFHIIQPPSPLPPSASSSPSCTYWRMVFLNECNLTATADVLYTSFVNHKLSKNNSIIKYNK